MSKMQFLFKNISLDTSWKIIVLLFFLGLYMRLVVFLEPHYEGDELIYMALVDQLDQGKGYTLLGSPLLEKGIVSKKQYSGKLFHHPLAV